MNERKDPFARARDEQDPGASSGSEHQAKKRKVPGTASSREGYQHEGTGAGEPLKGVEADDRDDETS
ncbi:hypothetical protein [Streptomyces tritici]|uniref:hypothetical protein n=1 Tax=Streptomyces tritici TaxID=2054410 RepID=UPI003AF07B6F